MAENILFSDWEKLDLRNALVAGLKQYYTRDELVGKRVIVFTNLEPRTIRGIESKGMILAVSNADHSEVKLLQTDGAVDLGNPVG